MYGPRTLKVKVVGVSFDNDDGSSRQEILRDLKGGQFLLPTLQRFEYDGNPAYRVLCNDMQIGNIPADLAAELAEQEDAGYVLMATAIEIYGGPDEEIPDRYYGAAVHLLIAPERTGTRSTVNSSDRTYRDEMYRAKREYDQAAAKPRLVRKWALIIAGILIAAVFLYDKIMDIIDAIILRY